MELNKEQIQELMKERGYAETAQNSEGTLLYFIKTKNNICLHATINTKLQHLILDTPGNLKLGFLLTSGKFAINHKDFQDFEDALYRYAYICSQDNRKDKKEDNPVSTFKTRKDELWEQIRQVGKEKKYDKHICIAFFKYWTEHNEGAKKMRFEMQEVFNVSRRLITWLENEKKFTPKWKTAGEKKVQKQEEDLKKQTKIIDKTKMF